MQWIGGGGLYAFAAGMNLMLAIFILYRKFIRTAAPNEQLTDFVAMPQTSQSTQAMVGLDPRMPQSDNGNPEKPAS